MMKHDPAAMSPSAEDEDLEVDNQLTVTSLSGKPLLDFIAAKKSKKARKRPKWSKEEIERLRSNFVPPDGGYGWFIALGAFTVQFWVAGLIKSYGVIFVEVLLLFPDASASLASWIPAMLSTFCFIFGTFGIQETLATTLSGLTAYRRARRTCADEIDCVYVSGKPVSFVTMTQ